MSADPECKNCDVLKSEHKASPSACDDFKPKRCGDCQSWSRGGAGAGRGGGYCLRWMIPKIANNFFMSECWENRGK